MILGKKDVVKNAAAEWTSKWTPAILAYSRGIRGKAAQSAVQEAAKKYESMYVHTQTRNRNIIVTNFSCR